MFIGFLLVFLPGRVLSWSGIVRPERIGAAQIVGALIGAGGALLLSPSNPLEADYVFTQPGIELDGERIASGTNAELVLWRVDGPVTVVGAETNDELRTRACSPANA